MKSSVGIKTGFGFKEILCWNKNQDFGYSKFSVIKNRIWFNEILCWNKNRILVQRNSLLE